MKLAERVWKYCKLNIRSEGHCYLNTQINAFVFLSYKKFRGNLYASTNLWAIQSDREARVDFSKTK